MNEDELKAILRFSLKETGGSPQTPACPDEHSSAAYVDGALDGHERDLFQQHLADCDFCTRRVGFLNDLRESAPIDQMPDLLMARARRLGRRKPRTLQVAGRWASAAVIVLAFSTIFYVSFDPKAPADHPVLAQPTGELTGAVRLPSPETPGPQLLSPNEGSIVDADQLVISWTEIPGSLYYDIQIVTEDGDLVYETRTTGRRVVPDDDLALAPGSEYFVLVEAYLADDKTLGSNHVLFKVAEP